MEEDDFSDWNTLGVATVKILDLHKSSNSVQAYGFFFLGGLTLVPNNFEILGNLQNDVLLGLMSRNIDIYWTADPWAVLNTLLLLKYFISRMLI